MYREGVFITEIAQRTGFGTTTIFRWASAAGIVKPFSQRLAEGSQTRQFGREVIGKKGAFHTVKGGAWIHTDSTYEYARLSQLEELPGVTRLDRCRDRIRYAFGGKQKTYIPDFRIELADGAVIIEEVKPARWVADAKVRAKVDAALAFYADTGCIFRVITEHDIGQAMISAASDSLVSRQSPDHVEAVKERRRLQRAANQRAYTARKRAAATDEQLQEMRRKNATFQRKYRAGRKKIAS